MVLPASWSEERGFTGRKPNWSNCSPGKTIVDQAYDGQHYKVHQVEDKVEPIIFLGLDEGAGVDDLDIVGLMHHQSLDVPLYSSSIRSDTQAEKSLFASPMLSMISFHF